MFDLSRIHIPHSEDDVKTFWMTNSVGEEIECTILFTVDDLETGLHYIVYTNGSTDENGNTVVLANIFDPEADEGELLPILDDGVWAELAQLFDSLNELQDD